MFENIRYRMKIKVTEVGKERGTAFTPVSFYPGLILVMILSLFSTSCTEENLFEKTPDLQSLSIDLDIEGASRIVTRVKQGTEDNWSNLERFTEGDKIGFYASGGNWLNCENDYFDNYELTYNGENRFMGPNGETVFSPSDMDGNEVYLYYPYSPQMNEPGLELRQFAPPTTTTTNVNSPYRCVDFLAANQITMEGEISEGNIMALYGTCKHIFAELIIMRGPGFDNPKPGQERITAVINRECTNIRVDFDMSNGWSCNPQLYYYDGNQAQISRDNSRKWDAWKGANFHIPDKNTQTDYEGEEAWYVIIPTLGTGNSRSSVEYIELYDNDGNLQRVSSLKLAGVAEGRPTKYVESGWRYPMTITMEELVPTVNPYPISRWNNNIDLTDERDRGIHDLIEFTYWVSHYNAYLADPSNVDKQNNLRPYGDKIVNEATNEITWHFYLMSDIDLSTYNPLSWEGKEGEDINPQNNVIIPELNDIFDGVSTTLSNGRFLNYKISGLDKSFVGKIEGGTLQNLDFIEPKIINENSTDAAGIISTSLSKGYILNCGVIDGTLLNPKGPAGMVTGEISDSEIRNCTITGALFRDISTGEPSGNELLFGIKKGEESSFVENIIEVMVNQAPDEGD